jgi:polysaccharide export outer membrane protein
MPTTGPTTAEVVGQGTSNGQPRFTLVEVDGRVVETLAARSSDSFSSVFAHYGRPASPTIGIGDSVSVSIWQSTGVGPGMLGGTLGTGITTTNRSSGATAVLPDQIVAADGGISIPYGGRARAAGRTPFQVQQDIERLLADAAVKPQVIVTVTKSASDKVTVLGDVVGGMRVTLSFRGERLLDVIAAAGGPKSATYETVVRLSRAGSTVSVPLDTLVTNPSENIFAWPDDVITVVRVPQTFLVFGAAATNTQIPFNAPQLNLAQAIAKAGGLNDNRADPAGVFLFRFEPKAAAASVAATEPLVLTTDGRTPVLYHLNMQDVNGYFLAHRFAVKNDDMIYVANATSNELQKFLTLIGSLVQPVLTGGVLIQTLKQ